MASFLFCFQIMSVTREKSNWHNKLPFRYLIVGEFVEPRSVHYGNFIRHNNNQWTIELYTRRVECSAVSVLSLFWPLQGSRCQQRYWNVLGNQVLHFVSRHFSLLRLYFYFVGWRLSQARATCTDELSLVRTTMASRTEKMEKKFWVLWLCCFSFLSNNLQIWMEQVRELLFLAWSTPFWWNRCDIHWSSINQ